MSEWIEDFTIWWAYKVSPQWSTIIPLLLFVIGLIWFFVVYNRAKFRFLPSFAIARVTIQDSIGKMEVVILLVIGMMIVGVNGIIPNTAEGQVTLKNWLSLDFFQQHLEEYTGGRDITVYDKDMDTSSLDMRGMGDFSGSTVEDAVTPDITNGTPEETPLEPSGQEPPMSPGDLSDKLQNQMIQNLIWQGAFLMADFFVALIGFVLAMVVLPTEINRGVILSILPKPITREEYIFGKAMGIWVIVSGCFLILTCELFVIQAFFDLLAGTNPMNWKLVMAMVLFPFKYATLILIIMWMTLRMPEVPAAIVGLAIFMVGHFHDKIFEIGDNTPSIILKIGIKVAYYIIPHLSQATFSILDKDVSMITNFNQLWGWVWQISVYNIILLWLLSLWFKKRSL